MSDKLDKYLAELPVEEKQKLLRQLQYKTDAGSQDNYLQYIQYMDPLFCQGPHHEIIAEKLEAVERGDITRLMIFMPPRSSKSYMTSNWFPTWFFGRHPRAQILHVTYTIDLAEEWGRFARNVLTSPEYQRVFPDITVSSDSRSAIRWDTNKGGRYRAAGITGGIAGKGASLAIIDDPLNEQDAYSKAAREHVKRWYPGGLRSRLMPGGRIILTSTRWHEDDLPGWLLAEAEANPKKEQWEVLNIPALLDKKSSVLLDLPEGTTYWPPHQNPPDGAELIGWSTDYLLQTREDTPPDQWQALYMQNPTAEGGNIIKTEYWQRWQGTEPPGCDYIFMSLDTAFSQKETANYSAITTWGIFHHVDPETEERIANLILLGAKKGRWDFPQLKQEFLETYEFHRPDNALIEKKASGQSLIQELVKSGFPVIPYQPDKDKEARAHACTPMFWSERVWAPRKRWAEDVIMECASFPSGRHDDYVDCVTQAVLWVRENILVIQPDEPWHDEDEDFKVKRRRKFY